jgi:hypothetical protein
LTFASSLEVRSELFATLLGFQHGENFRAHHSNVTGTKSQHDIARLCVLD